MAYYPSRDDVQAALDGLIEAQDAADEAQEERQRCQGANKPPPPRNLYEDVQELFVYARIKAQHEEGLRRANDKVDQTKEAREKAAARVREFLPVNSQVIYDYHGQYGADAPTRYTILHGQQGDVTVRKQAPSA